MSHQQGTICAADGLVQMMLALCVIPLRPDSASLQTVAEPPLR